VSFRNQLCVERYLYCNKVIVNVSIDCLPGEFLLTCFVRFTNYTAIISLSSLKQSAGIP